MYNSFIVESTGSAQDFVPCGAEKDRLLCGKSKAPQVPGSAFIGADRAADTSRWPPEEEQERHGRRVKRPWIGAIGGYALVQFLACP